MENPSKRREASLKRESDKRKREKRIERWRGEQGRESPPMRSPEHRKKEKEKVFGWVGRRSMRRKLYLEMDFNIYGGSHTFRLTIIRLALFFIYDITYPLRI
ncbi:hypothetical protein VNO80_17799 [Phaseolus coccineus]|uniref:Uncharacterized protein n=1 Tax=Phaseolus coccineus TaxID=3886 RepID=A0AAN9MD07_PHACN